MANLPIKRLAGEFVIIVCGVLAALGVDQWRIDREDRADEIMFVQRLIADLENDSSSALRAQNIGDAVVPRLDSVLATLGDSAAIRAQPSRAWPRLSFTYSRPPLQTTTFDELTSSGRLELIRDDDLRFAVGNHYHDIVHHFDRLDDRKTRIAWALADIFPTVTWGSGMPFDPADQIDSTFYQAPNAEARLQRILGPEYQGLLNQERIYARSMEEISEDMLGWTTEMLAQLRAYEAEIR